MAWYIFISPAKSRSHNNNSIQFFIYLRAELNNQWPITESERIQTTAIRQHRTKPTTKTTTLETIKQKNGSSKAFYTQI
jgi:hypothetical protein